TLCHFVRKRNASLEQCTLRRRQELPAPAQCITSPHGRSTAHPVPERSHPHRQSSANAQHHRRQPRIGIKHPQRAVPPRAIHSPRHVTAPTVSLKPNERTRTPATPRSRHHSRRRQPSLGRRSLREGVRAVSSIQMPLEVLNLQNERVLVLGMNLFAVNPI